MRLIRIAAMAVLAFCIAGPALAQERIPITPEERNQYVISISAGAVNVVEGDVTYKGESGDWDMLIAGDSLGNGSRVKTGPDGRAEILLNPGSYLRLSENTEIVFQNTSLYRLKIEVVRGCASIEAAVADGQTDAPATIITPKSEFYILKGGLYRFNVAADGRTEALVRKGGLVIPVQSENIKGKKLTISIPGPSGRVVVPSTVISGGKKVVIEGSEPALLSFNKKDEDEFDLWSKNRAKTLIAANKKLKIESRRGLISSSVWVYNPLFGGYCFLPAYYGYSSPYGWRYPVSCNNRWNRPGYRHPGGGGNSHGSGGSSSTGSGSTSAGRGSGSGAGSGVRGGGGAGAGGGMGGGRGNVGGAAPSSPRGNNRPPQ